MTFGFSTTLGFVAPTADELVEDAAAKYQAATGIVVDLEQGSPTLYLLRAWARVLKPAYDDQGGTYNSGFVGSASGAGLQNLLTPFIGPPLPDAGSTVVLPLTGVAATVVSAGSTVLLDSDGAGALPWVLQANVVIPNDGTFVYSEPGPKSAIAASTWTIGTPVVGWATADPSVADAAQGRLAETELEYKIRFSQSVEGTRIAAAVLGVDGVTSVNVFENFTDIPDSFWGATHWVEVLHVGGTDLAVATAIQNSRAFTVQPLGSIHTPVAVANYEGGSVTIGHSPPAGVSVWTELTITKGEGYSADTSAGAVAARELAIKDQIIAWAGTRPVGLDVSAFQVATVAALTPGVPGISNIVATVGLVNPPLDAIVVAGPRDLIVFSEPQILLNGV